MLWASKVREQISKRPPGSSILGSQTVLSISSAKRSYNVEMRRRTFNQGHGNFWLRWPLLVSLARCGGMFTICTLMIKGTCIILVKMWEIERKKKTLYKCIRQRLQKSYFWCFSLTWWGLIMHPLSKMRSVQLTCYCFLFLLFLFQLFFFLTKYICIHTYFGDKVNNRKHIWNTNWKTFKKTKIKDVGSDLTPSKWVCWWCWCTSVMLSTLFINNSIFPKYMQY